MPRVSSKPADKFERDMQTREDAEALKRIAAMKNDRERFERARSYVEKEQKEISGAKQVASGLRRKRNSKKSSTSPATY